MIRTLSDLLRHYGDRTVLTLTGDGNGKRTVVTFEIDHPGECWWCIGTGHGLSIGTCPECHGSGLALDIGGEG